MSDSLPGRQHLFRYLAIHRSKSWCSIPEKPNRTLSSLWGASTWVPVRRNPPFDYSQRLTKTFQSSNSLGTFEQRRRLQMSERSFKRKALQSEPVLEKKDMIRTRGIQELFDHCISWSQTDNDTGATMSQNYYTSSPLGKEHILVRSNVSSFWHLLDLQTNDWATSELCYSSMKIRKSLH